MLRNIKNQQRSSDLIPVNEKNKTYNKLGPLKLAAKTVVGFRWKICFFTLNNSVYLNHQMRYFSKLCSATVI